jgi:predicted metalloprotease with PDZ domain
MLKESVVYRVDLVQRRAHLFHIEALFPIGQEGPLELRLPVWTPGSYLIREYERHLQDLECFDETGRRLSVRKTDKATWRVEANGAASVRAVYRVYGYDLTVRSSHLDDTHALLNGASLFLYTDPLRHRPCVVEIKTPPEWRTTVALDRAPGPGPGAGDQNVFLAADYDELVDSPFEVGTHEVIEFRAAGRPHRFAIHGEARVDRKQLIGDVTKIVETAAALFDGLPYSDYTFILFTAPSGYGGLEHRRSTALLASPFSFSPRAKYEEFLELVSHEFFHLWNVKRIHPEVLGPFDYQKEAYTRCLWMMEGITSYYDRLLLVRAGLQSPERYLQKMAEEIAKIEATPGRLHQSLEEASFDAWVKHYRPDENSINSTISYYLKGGMVALLLDLEIRSRSIGKRSLDDVMRHLWNQFGKRERGFPEDAVEALMEEATGVPLGSFFARHIRGCEELELDRILQAVGLEVRRSHSDENKGGWLGAHLRESDSGVEVAAVLSGGPAEEGGLYADDEIVALDGFRVRLSSLKERLQEHTSGEEVTLTVFRRDALRTIRMQLGVAPTDKVEVGMVKSPSEAQRAALAAWLGGKLPQASS